MQELVLKIGVELAYSKEKSWAVYNKTESYQRNVAKDKVKQGKSEERNITKHSNCGDDLWDWVADKRIGGIKKIVLKRMERKDS